MHPISMPVVHPLEHPMGIESHMLPRRIIVNVVITGANEFGVDFRGKTGLALHGAASHWLLPWYY